MSNKISELINQRIRWVGRAAAMGTFAFGEDVSSIIKSKEVILPKYSLHIQCSFRIRQGAHIIISNLDMFQPKDSSTNYDEFDWDVFGNNLYDVCTEKLNQIFAEGKITVIAVDTSETFDLKITLSNEYVIEVFVNAPKDSETWRFFRRDSGECPHFVVERMETVVGEL